MHRFPWNGKAALHFRTDRDIFDILPKRIGEKTIQLMTTIITDVLTQQAGADA
jgi:hypothetical protein